MRRQPLRVAVLSPRAAYADRMDLTHCHLMDRVASHPAFTVLDPDRIPPAGLGARLGSFDALLNDEWTSWDRAHPEVAAHPHLLVGKFWNDVQYAPEDDRDYDFYVHRYCCPLARERWDPARSFYLRHHLDTGVFRDRCAAKQVDVLVYGRLSEDVYPFRTRVARLLTEALPGRVRLLEHPGYQTGVWRSLWRFLSRRPMIRGADLSREIGRARLALVTPSRLGFLVAKYAEVALSGAVPLGNAPPEATALLENGLVAIRPEQADAEIVATVERALADPDDLRRRSELLGARFRSRCDSARYAEKLLRIVSLAAGRESEPGDDADRSPEGRPIL